MSNTTQTDPPSLRDWGTSWLRTLVPVAWGYLLTFLATRAPDVHAVLDGPYLLAAATSLATLAWYALVRAVEHKLPAWLTRLVIGANTPPQYVDGSATTGPRTPA